MTWDGCARTIDEMPPQMRHLARACHQKLMGQSGKPLAGFLRLLALLADRGYLDTELTGEGNQLFSNVGSDNLSNNGETLQFDDVFFNVMIVDEAFCPQKSEQGGLAEGGGDGGVTKHGALVIRRVSASEVRQSDVRKPL